MTEAWKIFTTWCGIFWDAYVFLLVPALVGFLTYRLLCKVFHV
jgi:hypothetical protein